MTIEKDETREYVAAITAELAAMAQQAGLPFLAYLLRLAQTEASGRATIVQQGAKAGSSGALMRQSRAKKGDAAGHVAG